jgi:hypothetical protein
VCFYRFVSVVQYVSAALSAPTIALSAVAFPVVAFLPAVAFPAVAFPVALPAIAFLVALPGVNQITPTFNAFDQTSRSSACL